MYNVKVTDIFMKNIKKLSKNTVVLKKTFYLYWKTSKQVNLQETQFLGLIAKYIRFVSPLPINKKEKVGVLGLFIMWS